MIRVRRAGGELLSLPSDAAFVELVCQDGSVVTVLAVDNEGNTHTVEPGSIEALRYQARYPDTKWAKLLTYGTDTNS